MKTKKRLTSIMALFLTVFMIVGMLPSGVIAAPTKGLVTGQTKARVSVVLMQEDSSATGAVKFSEVSEMPAITAGTDFYVGIKVDDLDHIQDLNDGFQSLGFALFWDKTYVEFQDKVGNFINQNNIKNRAQGTTQVMQTPALYFSPAVVSSGDDTVMDYYSYGNLVWTANATSAVTVGSSSKLNAANASKLQGDIKHNYTTDIGTYGELEPTFKDASFYALIVKFKALQDAPTDGNGAQIFDLSVARTDSYIDFGTSKDKIHYEYGGDTGSDMSEIIEFSTNDADIYPSTYPVYYDANVGSLTLNNVSINGGDTTVETGRTMTALANGIADGYKVTSWNTAADGTGTTIVVGDAGTKIDRNMISTYTKEGETDEETGLHLYAQWESLYAVTFDGNGGVDGSNETSRSYDFATSVTGTLNTVDGTQDKNGVTVDLPDINNAGNEFTRTGYDFDGWYKADNSGYYTVGTRIIDWADVTVGSATYFINWNSNLLPEDQSIVTFDANGTTWDDMDDVKSVTVNTGDMINPDPSTSTLAENMPVPPTRTGYVFKGWNTQANGAGTDFTGKTVVNGDMDVYAVWELAPDVAPKNTVVINFDLGLDGKTVPNQPTIKNNPYNVYVAAEGGLVTVDASIIPTLSSESIQEANGTEWSFVGWQITDIGGTPATTDYEVGATFNAVAGGATNVTVTAQWGETKRITLHLGNLTADELAAAGLASEEVVLRGVNGQDLTQSADYKKLITSVNATATTIGESKLHGHWEFVALSSVPRAQADVTKLYEAVTDIKFADEPEVYAFWQLSLSVAASEDVSLTYTGAALDWNADPAAPAIDIWYGDSLDNETGKYTARANGDLTLDTDYEVEIYNSDDTEPRTELPEIKDVINYLVNFVSLKPAGDTGIEKYDPIVFEDDSVDLNIEPMAVKVKVNSVTGGSKGTAPDSGTTSGAALTVGDGKGIEVVEPDTLYTPEMKAAIEAAIEVKYRLLNEGAPTVGTTYDTADLSTGPDASGTEDDPYALGNYIMVIGAKGNSNFKVTEVEFAAATGAAALTSPDDITPNLANNLGITDGSHTAAIYTVEISNLTVTFKYPTAMPENSSDPVNLDGTATVEVEKGTTIKDATDPNVEMPTLDKITDYQCEGWFVATGADDAALYASAQANYNTWKADKDANAALKFDENTVVNNDVTVVAVWVDSEDGTLVPDPKDPENPNDDVPALAVKVYKDDGNANGTPAKGEDGTTDIAETITEFKQNDYTTAQVFTPNDTSIEYYLRVDNKYDYANIQWNTAENGSKVEIKRKGDDGNYTIVSSYVVGELSVMAQGNKSVALEVAKDGNANDFQIVVTPPAGAGTDNANVKTYTLHIQRLYPSSFKLNYGNSPYGMIMKDPTVNENHSLYGSTDADAIAQWQTDAKAAFDMDNMFASTYMPKNAPTKIYHTSAWNDATDADHNMDRNDYAIFVYNRTDFRDPGFELRDALGNLVDATQVTRYVEDLKRSTTSLSGLENPTTTARFDLPTGVSDMLYTTITDKNGSVEPVKPGVYKLHYEYLDKSINPDGELISGFRYLIVLNEIGDADFSGGVNTSDGTTVNAIAVGTVYAGIDALFMYRVADADNSGGVNTSDTTTVNSIAVGNKEQPFYNALPDA